MAGATTGGAGTSGSGNTSGANTGGAGAAGTGNGMAGASNGGAGAGGAVGANNGGTAGGSTADSGGATNGGTAGGGTPNGGTAGGGTANGGTANGGTAGSSGGGNCTPSAAGTFVVQGDVVFDPKTCLSWTKATMAGQPYAAAETYCAGLSLGGYDDWRLPTAGEVVSIFKCDGMYPPVAEVFTVMGDGIWTTTLSGTIAGDEPKVCGAGQASGQYYDFGKVGGQNTRCVRGATTLPDRTDCKTNNAICK